MIDNGFFKAEIGLRDAVNQAGISDWEDFRLIELINNYLAGEEIKAFERLLMYKLTFNCELTKDEELKMDTWACWRQRRARLLTIHLRK